MFGKKLRRELIQYLRCLWPFAIAAAATGVLAYVIVLTDKNPIEATGSISAIGIFVMAALALAVRALIHAYVSFKRNISAEKIENEQAITQLLWVPITAFMIIMSFIILIIIAGVSAFAWEAIVQKFLAFDTEWLYFLEFMLYLIIATFTLFIIPATRITVSRLSKHKKWPRVLSLIVCIVFSLIHFVLLVFEIQLLIHSPSTNMVGLWASIITLLAITTIVDVCMYLLTYCTLQEPS